MTRMKLTIAVLIIVLAGCGGSRNAGKEEDGGNTGDDLRRFESDFRPSDYDPDPESRSEGVPKPSGETEAPKTDASNTEQIPGFRVQIFSSTSIDEANSRKSAAEQVFPNEWFYLRYDPPSYKVRAGNFTTRFDAERFAKVAIDNGFPGSWPVPERVYKTPPHPQAPEPQQAPR
jgi:SPOR domain